MRTQHPSLTTPFKLVTEGNAIFADTSCYLHCFSLHVNELGPEGGKAIADALKVNDTITNIK